MTFISHKDWFIFLALLVIWITSAILFGEVLSADAWCSGAWDDVRPRGC